MVTLGLLFVFMNYYFQHKWLQTLAIAITMALALAMLITVATVILTIAIMKPLEVAKVCAYLY